jgi:hypothetical protein
VKRAGCWKTPKWSNFFSPLSPSASRFRKAAFPASDGATHFGSGEAWAPQLSCQFHHFHGGVWGKPSTMDIFVVMRKLGAEFVGATVKFF